MAEIYGLHPVQLTLYRPFDIPEYMCILHIARLREIQEARDGYYREG